MINQIIPENDYVFIGVCGERFDIPDFGESKDSVLLTAARHIKQLHITRGHRVDRNRDKIVSAFLERADKPDWLLFLDSDMVFPKDIIYRLMSHRVPVVGGLYFHRTTHAPFVFMESHRSEDEWGRLIRKHEFMYGEVYDFLKRSGIPPRNQAAAVDGVSGRLVQCDAIATGAMMIHRSVVAAMEPPWFEYVEHAESEDLSFCRKAREAGFSVYADLGTICGHLHMVPEGYAQFMESHKKRGVFATNYTREEARETLAELHGEQDVDYLMSPESTYGLADLWHKMKEDPVVRDIDFYRNHEAGRLYLGDLLRWNASPLFAGFREELIGIEDARVLEVGAGIGTLAIQLAVQGCDVDAFESNSILREFAARRLEWIDGRDKIIGWPGKISWFTDFRPGAKLPSDFYIYDLVVAVDVFEHMDEDALRRAIGLLANYLKPGGRMFCHNAWGDHTTDGVHPFHYDHSDIWNDIIHDNGLFQLSRHWLIKEYEL